MTTISTVLEAMGGNKGAARRFGVGESAVSNWRAVGAFPKRLHLDVYRFCQERGIDYDPAADAQQRQTAA